MTNPGGVSARTRAPGIESARRWTPAAPAGDRHIGPIVDEHDRRRGLHRAR